MGLREKESPASDRRRLKAKMKAASFVEPGRIVIEDKPIPDVSPLDALIRIQPSAEPTFTS
jgi:alcohol dehydrogenase